ncbi:hypothetical protein BCR39DRAFT_526140 [Naematelia encephala]|uniref:Uncharacterized protein n=1 Tax=Naematelia encephala TaxID=71784 RepID=A0A1Y2BC37_9TREE|nr:hypothetical protein BCR39DRAFT_526140 [Naematelia encephala]
MLTTSRNAQYVLGLVLRQASTRRQVSSTASATVNLETFYHDDDSARTAESSTPTQTLFVPHPANAPSLSISSFLEDDMSEYQAATITLPPRDFRPRPLEWPTLRAPKQNQQSTEPVAISPDIQNPAQRDLMAELVLKGDYAGARQLYAQLTEMRVKIPRRQIYFQPAMEALERDDFDSFFFWLELYPNRPAKPNNPHLKQQWDPVITKMIGRDPETICTFLELAGGRKGLNPTILVPLMVHLQHKLPAQQMRHRFEKILDSYTTHAMSSTSTSERAAQHRAVVDKQVQRWWNVFLRKWILLGSNQAALDLYEHPPDGVIWEEFTHRLVGDELRQGTSTDLKREFIADAMASRKWPQQPSPTGKWTLFSWNEWHTWHQLPGRLRSVLSYQEPAFRLAEVIQLVQRISDKHPTLLNRLESRYCSETIYSHHSSTMRKLKWNEALLIIDRKSLNDVAAVEKFQRSYLWVGLPDHPARQPITTAQSEIKRRHPTLKVINAVLPSLIRLLPQPRSRRMHDFHRAYLDSAPSLPPSLQPDNRTHTVFVDTISRVAGPHYGMRALRTMIQRGYKPSRAAYLAVLYTAATWNNKDIFCKLLSTMERKTTDPAFRNQDGNYMADLDPLELGNVNEVMSQGLVPVDYFKLAKFWARRGDEQLAGDMLIAAQSKARESTV